MLIKRTSLVSGKTHVVEIDVTPDQITEWKNGASIQDVMPDLSPTDREFLMTGITDVEWGEAYA